MDGGWTQWSSWSSCSKTCGVGSRTRTRTCTNPAPVGGGADCVGTNNRTKSCNEFGCPGKAKGHILQFDSLKSVALKIFAPQDTP